MATTVKIIDIDVQKIGVLGDAELAGWMGETVDINEKLKDLEIENADSLGEIQECFENLTEEEIEMFLLDALWVNERLQDYSTTLGEIPEEEKEEAGVALDLLSDDEEEEFARRPEDFFKSVEPVYPESLAQNAVTEQRSQLPQLTCE